jgi:hypothetical protein
MIEDVSRTSSSLTTSNQWSFSDGLRPVISGRDALHPLSFNSRTHQRLEVFLGVKVEHVIGDITVGLCLG